MMKRREFLTYSGIGTAALLAGCGQATPPTAAPAAAPEAGGGGKQPPTMTTVTIDFIGGFAYVSDGNELIVGSVLTSHHPNHGMELRLVTGGRFNDKTSMPSAAATPAQTNFKHRWIVDGRDGTVDGLTGPFGLPPDSNSDTPPFPTTSAKWDDLSYLHRLQRYHSGAKLKTKWQDSLPTRLSLKGGTMSVVEPDHPCMLKGLWIGHDAGGAQKFLKPLATTVRVTGAVTGDLVLSFGSESITFTPVGDKVDLKVYATSLLPTTEFVKPNKQEHMAMFYELVVDGGGNPIKTADQVLPAFESWESSNKCTPPPGPAYIPGEGCSPNFFSV